MSAAAREPAPVNPYAAPAIVPASVPELLPLEPWEVAFEGYRPRWIALVRIGRSGIAWGAIFLLLTSMSAATLWRLRPMAMAPAAVVGLMGLAFLIDGIGILLLRPWGRWAGVVSAALLLVWQGVNLTSSLRFGRNSYFINFLPMIAMVFAVRMLYVLLTPPSAELFTEAFREILRQAKASGKPLIPKARTNYWVLLVLLLMLIGLFLAISRL